jgi:hypothetical protein
MSRVRTTDFTEYEFGSGRSYLSMGCWQGPDRTYRQGLFRAAPGLIEIYEQTGAHPMTNMRFRHAGRDYGRCWRTVWGEKTLARLAREFMEEVLTR